MDISNGFQIEQPNIFVPWRITESELLALGGDDLHHVTRGYYTAPCVSVSGLSCNLGFHFRPSVDGRLAELEFFRRFAMPLADSYADFQRHFESVFGPPTTTEDGSEGFPSHTWLVRGARIVHYVFDRFGPEEHMNTKTVTPNHALQRSVSTPPRPSRSDCNRGLGEPSVAPFRWRQRGRQRGHST